MAFITIIINNNPILIIIMQVLLLDIFPSLVDLSTDLAQALTLLISKVVDFTNVFRRTRIIVQDEAGGKVDGGELRMYGFVVLAAAWAPGFLTLVLRFKCILANLF